ncbi:MAG: hypothetical protein ACRDS0_16310, partial [Pseudonocardiaceae bacterium]
SAPGKPRHDSSGMGRSPVRSCGAVPRRNSMGGEMGRTWVCEGRSVRREPRARISPLGCCLPCCRPASWCPEATRAQMAIHRRGARGEQLAVDRDAHPNGRRAATAGYAT